MVALDEYVYEYACSTSTHSESVSESSVTNSSTSASAPPSAASSAVPYAAHDRPTIRSSAMTLKLTSSVGAGVDAYSIEYVVSQRRSASWSSRASSTSSAPALTSTRRRRPSPPEPPSSGASVGSDESVGSGAVSRCDASSRAARSDDRRAPLPEAGGARAPVRALSCALCASTSTQHNRSSVLVMT